MTFRAVSIAPPQYFINKSCIFQCGKAQLLNCNQILDPVADRNCITFIDSMSCDLIVQNYS